MDVLVKGNKLDGSESAPVIGVGDTQNGIQYRDLLRVWIRASRLGRQFRTIIGGEEQALDLLDLPEFKLRSSGTTDARLNLKTPVPNSADFYIHGGTPENEVMLVDPSAAMIKLTANRRQLQSSQTIYRHGKNQSIGARRTHRREAGTIDGEDRTRRTGDLDGWRNRRSKLVAKSVDYPHVRITGFG